MVDIPFSYRYCMVFEWGESMKLCRTCNTEKEESFFHVRKASKDGLSPRCKDCCKIYDKSRANLPHRVKARAEYAKTERGKEAGRRAKNAWIERNEIKRGAHHIVNNAIRSGKMVKPDNCEKCEATGKIHGHHCDYAKPLEVMWLCPQCHDDWHKENGEGLNAE